MIALKLSYLYFYIFRLVSYILMDSPTRKMIAKATDAYRNLSLQDIETFDRKTLNKYIMFYIFLDEEQREAYRVEISHLNQRMQKFRQQDMYGKFLANELEQTTFQFVKKYVKGLFVSKPVKKNSKRPPSNHMCEETQPLRKTEEQEYSLKEYWNKKNKQE